ncbi:MAG: hypothetical protein GX591_03980 [Planctomycetes bacterium]|nr:hypothetical protein [Planctomycetota bacterium]
MRIGDILEHFLSRAGWVDRTRTVDRIIVGDPSVDVDRCAVAWIPDRDAIDQTERRGIRLLMVHEPTFWDHFDRDPEGEAGGRDKRRRIEDAGITIVRNHDCWDRWPDVGVPWSWARFLRLPGPPARMDDAGYRHRYDIDPVPFDAFAASVAARTAELGEGAVEVVGDGDRLVSRVGIGTGCIADVATFLALGCDVCICTDDGSAYWRDIQHARDLDLPVICVNHATSEEPAMAALADYINRHLNGVAAEHLPQGCRFRRIGQA